MKYAGAWASRSKTEGCNVQDTTLMKLLEELGNIEDQRAKVELKVLEQLFLVDRDVANMAIDVFDEKAAAASWLVDECPALGNEKPLSLLLQGKRKLVLDCLNQIKYGMWA